MVFCCFGPVNRAKMQKSAKNRGDLKDSLWGMKIKSFVFKGIAGPKWAFPVICDIRDF
jgi:hypothetical protein